MRNFVFDEDGRNLTMPEETLETQRSVYDQCCGRYSWLWGVCIMADDEKKTSVEPHSVPLIIGNPDEFERVHEDKVVLSNGMSMEEVANDPELLKEYAEEQGRLYVQRVRNLQKTQADRIQREEENNSGVPFNSMQEVLDDLKARREASESDE